MYIVERPGLCSLSSQHPPPPAALLLHLLGPTSKSPLPSLLPSHDPLPAGTKKERKARETEGGHRTPASRRHNQMMRNNGKSESMIRCSHPLAISYPTKDPRPCWEEFTLTSKVNQDLNLLRFLSCSSLCHIFAPILDFYSNKRCPSVGVFDCMRFSKCQAGR